MLCNHFFIRTQFRHIWFFPQALSWTTKSYEIYEKLPQRNFLILLFFFACKYLVIIHCFFYIFSIIAVTFLWSSLQSSVLYAISTIKKKNFFLLMIESTLCDIYNMIYITFSWLPRKNPLIPFPIYRCFKSYIFFEFLFNAL